MINLTEEMWDIWESGKFVGPNRPTTRITVSQRVVKRFDGSNWRTILFDQAEQLEVEIPNLQTVTIDRRSDADAASLSFTFLNQLPVTAYDPKNADGDLGQPGHFTFRRGQSVDADGRNRWGHEATLWSNLLVPNRLLMTYQGYGSDGAARPANDTRLVRTGVWLVDEVQYSAEGTVTVQCRDLAKLLIEQRLYPPIVPVGDYPLEIVAPHTVSEKVTSIVDQIPEGMSEGENVARHKKTYPDSSTAPWYGYNAKIYGGRASYAFDGKANTFWLSMGNNGPNKLWSFEWIEATTSKNPVNKVRIRPKWGGYVCYVGVMVNGAWQGSDTVPYGHWTSPAKPNGSNIKYIKKVRVPKNENWFEIDLGDVYEADAVRLVFTNLANSRMGRNPYRAAIYEMEVLLGSVKVEVEETVEREVEGNIGDYSDIIKLIAGWSGFYLPPGPGVTDDPFIVKWGAPGGRIWGDFFESGAYPVDPPYIEPSFFDNKSGMDVINEIRETLGFTFYVDQTGGIVWRPPNIWKTGNYVTGHGYRGEDSVRTVDERKVLIQYDASINDVALRSDIVVVSSEDPTIRGTYHPSHMQGEVAPDAVSLSDMGLLGGQTRVALVADYPFVSQAEVDKFAYLVGLWSHWSYRRSRFRIPGNPAFMPDDQVRIYERTTSETYLHYVEGVNSSMDLRAGTWFMDVDTHWLGNGPERQWFMDYSEMSAPLFAYLKQMDLLPDEEVLPESSYPSRWRDYWDDSRSRRITDGRSTRSESEVVLIDPVEVFWDQPPPWLPSGDLLSEGPGPDVLYAGSNDWMFYFWGTGPATRRPGQGGGRDVCNAANLITFPLAVAWREQFEEDPPYNSHPSQELTVSVRVDRRSVPAFEALVRIIHEEGLDVVEGVGFECVPSIAPNRILYGAGRAGSLVRRPSDYTWAAQSWGISVLLNWTEWPFGVRSLDPTVLRVVQRAVSLQTVSGKPLFVAGNNWKGNVEALRFTVVATPEDIASGIHWPEGGES